MLPMRPATQHSIDALNHGNGLRGSRRVWSLEDADRLYETVKRTGLKYMMFETSMFRENLYAMYRLYHAGCLGKLVYAEGEYWHYSEKGIDQELAPRDARSGIQPIPMPTTSR